jgi:hypothetical protein
MLAEIEAKVRENISGAKVETFDESEAEEE